MCSGLLAIIMMMFSGISFAQKQEIPVKGDIKIKPLVISISETKTTNLIFPYSVTSADRGNKDVLIQKAKGVENILQVKAAIKDFPETNLSVVLADGSFYSFILTYNPEPTVLNLTLATIQSNPLQPGILSPGAENEADLKFMAESVMFKKPSIRGPKQERFQVGIKLNGVFVKGDYLIFQLKLSNRSSLKYDIDQLRLYIRDKQVAKRTAFQEQEVEPIFVAGNQLAIGPVSEHSLIYIVKKFTIPDKKVLVLEMLEKNGGRHLKIRLKNKHLINAITIN